MATDMNGRLNRGTVSTAEAILQEGKVTLQYSHLHMHTC